MVSWRKALPYALALFTAQFLIGFAFGLMLPNDAVGRFSIQNAANTALTFAACTAIFTHLAVHQSERTVEHALLALVLQFMMSMILIILTLTWLGKPDLTTMGLELLVLSAALAAGTAFGRRILKGRVAPEA